MTRLERTLEEVKASLAALEAARKSEGEAVLHFAIGVDDAIEARFLETHHRAMRAIEEHREYLRECGRSIEEHVAWDMDDIGSAVEMRMTHLERSMERLKTAGKEVIAALWPGRRGAPTHRVAQWLEHTVPRLEAWKVLAA